MKKERAYDLEDRLINFSVLILHLSRKLPGTPEGKYFAGQLVRSGSSAALNYGEAQGAESRKDFMHKSRLVLKELRETLVNLKIIIRGDLLQNPGEILEKTLSECNELVSIFVKCIQTTEKNTLHKTNKTVHL